MGKFLRFGAGDNATEEDAFGVRITTLSSRITVEQWTQHLKGTLKVKNTKPFLLSIRHYIEYVLSHELLSDTERLALSKSEHLVGQEGKKAQKRYKADKVVLLVFELLLTRLPQEKRLTRENLEDQGRWLSMAELQVKHAVFFTSDDCLNAVFLFVLTRAAQAAIVKGYDKYKALKDDISNAKWVTTFIMTWTHVDVAALRGGFLPNLPLTDAARGLAANNPHPNVITTSAFKNVKTRGYFSFELTKAVASAWRHYHKRIRPQLCKSHSVSTFFVSPSGTPVTKFHNQFRDMLRELHGDDQVVYLFCVCCRSQADRQTHTHMHTFIQTARSDPNSDALH